MGGLSRALYFGGMIIAHFVALRAYKAALIGDVFMIQEDHDTKDVQKKHKKSLFRSESSPNMRRTDDNHGNNDETAPVHKSCADSPELTFE